MLAIDTPVQFIKGIGPRIAESLAEKGINTAEDLLYHLPFRYEDRANPRALHELVAGDMASVIGEVRGSVLLRTRGMPIFEMTLGQGTGTLKCIWFRGTYLKDRFQSGQTVAVFGKVEPSRSSRGFKMIQPQFEILPEATEEFSSLEMGRITPIYESLGGTKLGSRWVRRLLFNSARRAAWRIPETLPPRSSDGLVCRRAIRRCNRYIFRMPRLLWPVAERAYTGAPPAHLRGVVLPRTRAGDQTAEGQGACRYRVRA